MLMALTLRLILLGEWRADDVRRADGIRWADGICRANGFFFYLHFSSFIYIMPKFLNHNNAFAKKSSF